MAALRDRKFFSLRELNEAVAEKLDELNSRPFKQMAGCRRSAYLEEEKPYMLPLPVSAFEPAVWSVAKVANDYLVTDGRNKNSVPYNLIGERVDIRVTKTTVEVFYHGSRVSICLCGNSLIKHCGHLSGHIVVISICIVLGYGKYPFLLKKSNSFLIFLLLV